MQMLGRPQVAMQFVTFLNEIYDELKIRSVERGICAIATSTMNELFL